MPKADKCDFNGPWQLMALTQGTNVVDPAWQQLLLFTGFCLCLPWNFTCLCQVNITACT